MNKSNWTKTQTKIKTKNQMKVHKMRKTRLKHFKNNLKKWELSKSWFFLMTNKIF